MAGASVIGALRVVLGADTAALDNGLKDSQAGLAQFGTAVGVGLAAAAAAVAAAAVSIAGSIKTAIDGADKLNKASQSAGVTVEAFSKLQYAASLSDVSSESLGKSLGKLSKFLVSAANDGASPAAQAFTAMGIAIKNQDGTIKSSSDVISDIAAKFAGYKDGAEKTALAIAIFGKAGAAMIPLLNQGRDGLKQAGDEAQQFGLVLDKQTTMAAEAFNDNLKKMDLIKQGLYTTIAAKLLPTLQALSEQFLEQKKNSDFTTTAAEFVTTAIRVLNSEFVLLTANLKATWAELKAFSQLLNTNVTDIDGLKAAWKNWGDVVTSNQANLAEAKKGIASFSDALDGKSFSSRFNDATTSIGMAAKETARLREEAAKTSAPLLAAGDATKNALQAFLDSQSKRTAAQAAEAETVGKSVGEQAKLKLAYEANAIALAKGIALTPALTAQITAAGDAAAAAAMKLQGAQLIDQMTLPWDQRTQQLNQYSAAMIAAGASSDQLAAMQLKIQFPAFSAASIAATDFGMQLDQLATGAINSLSSNLAGLIAGTKTAAEAFKAFATQIIADLAAMIIKLLIYKAIRTAIFGFSEGGAVGGGGFTGTGLFSEGGNVTGPGTGTSDSIPAMLSDGEFVVNAQATKQWAPLLSAINSGSLPAFADGGSVSQQSAPVQSAPSVSKTIVLQGVMWGRDQMRDLFAALNEGMRDGHKLNVQFA